MEFNLIIWIFSLTLIKGQTLQEGIPDRTTVCAGTVLRGSCPSGKIIAVKDVEYGTKATATGCGTSGTSPGCCEYDAGDCLLPYSDTAQHAACSGKEVCDEITVAQADTSSCGNGFLYPGLNDYLTMEYYCILNNDPRTATFSTASLQETGSILYLKNSDYPNPIRDSETIMRCSVEARSCKSQLIIHFVHFELSCSQNLHIEDKGVNQTYTCSNNTGYNITMIHTSVSNYLKITLNNPDGNNDGKVWVAFEATESTAQIEVSCPFKDQTICMDCPALTYFSNGTVTTPDGISTDKNAHYSCVEGYKLLGNTTRVCLETGQWSGEEPKCQIKECQPLNNPENGKVTADAGLTVGQNATYKCDPGYDISGGTSRTCQVNAEWSGEEPTCVQIECPELPKPENGNVSTEGGLTVGQNATYTCNYGYKMNGDRWRTCQLDRIWSGAAPNCSEIECPELPKPENGDISTEGGLTVGQNATYTCNYGYKMNGDRWRTCQLDSTWSGTAPNCSEIVCPSLSPPSNGSVTVEGSSVGATASYNCSSNYELDGDATRTCLLNGAWNGTTPKCAPKTCLEPTHPEHGRVVFHGIEIGQSANYTCWNGYILDGAEIRTCLGSYTWSGSEPVCNARELGNNCTTIEDCSGAIPGATCDAGICVCAAHFIRDGNLCIAPAKEPDDENRWIKWLILGLSLGVGVIIIVIIVICCIRKRRLHFQKQECQNHQIEYNYDLEKYVRQNSDNAKKHSTDNFIGISSTETILVSPDSNDALNEENEIKHDRRSREYIKLQQQQHRIKKNPNEEDKDNGRKSTDNEYTPNDTEHELSSSGGEKLEDVQPKTDVSNTVDSTATGVNYAPNTEKNPDASIYHKEGTFADKTGIQTKTTIALDTDNVLIELIETKTNIQSEEFLTRHADVKGSSNITDDDERRAKRASKGDKINDEHLKPDRKKLDDADTENHVCNRQGSTKTQASSAGSVTKEKSSKDSMKEMEEQIEATGIGISLDEQFSDTGKLIDEVTKALFKSASMARRDLMTRPDVLGFKFDTFEGDEWSKGIVTAAEEVLAAIYAMCKKANALAKAEAGIDTVTIAASAVELKKRTNRLVIAYKVENDTQSNAMKNLKEACNAMNEAAKTLVSSAKQTQSRKTKTEKFTVGESVVAKMTKRIEVTENLERRKKDLEDAQKAYQEVNKEQIITQNGKDSNLLYTEL